MWLPWSPVARARPARIERERVGIGDRQRVVFAGDMHVSPAEPETLARSLAFLHSLRPDGGEPVAAVYLIGDIFDYWIGPAHARLPDHAEMLDCLRELARRLPVRLISGNRDFLIGRDFEALGVRVLSDWLLLRLESGGDETTCLVTHGDLLCTRDGEYRRYRATIRSGLVRTFAHHIIPAPVMVAIARAIRRSSGSLKRTNRIVRARPAEQFDITPDGIADALVCTPEAQHIVCGHVHRLETTWHPHPHPAHRAPVGLHIVDSWSADGGGYVEFRAGQFHLRRWPDP